MLGRISGAVRFKEPLSFHTSLRIGGPAEFFIVPHDLDDVRYAVAFAAQEDLPVVLLGGGNNLLAAERGIQAVVVKLGGILGRAEFDGDEVAVGAGMTLSQLIREASARDLGGLECMAGVPGSIGGALAADARTPDGALLDICSAVYFLHPDGTLGEFRPGGQSAGRTFDVPRGSIYVGCRMQLVRRPNDVIQKDIQQRLKRKRASHPFALASAGYIWKDPAGDRAARLIDSCGMRAKRMHDAEVSVKCSNLIVNRGSASYEDVITLMEMTRDRVQSQFGVTLRPRVTLLGSPASVAFEVPRLEPVGA
jgi:UDP-N-acetylmuramate dehydrogenase